MVQLTRTAHVAGSVPGSCNEHSHTSRGGIMIIGHEDLISMEVCVSKRAVLYRFSVG